jgi:hypothetical protein
VAVQKNNPDVVGLLLERGADPSALDKVSEGGCFVVVFLAFFRRSSLNDIVCFVSLACLFRTCISSFASFFRLPNFFYSLFNEGAATLLSLMIFLGLSRRFHQCRDAFTAYI